jgi:hypothetical protein
MSAAVLDACTLGVIIARYQLEDPFLAGASREDLTRIMGPALRAIVDPEPADGGADEGS